jgi:hypothetical protein
VYTKALWLQKAVTHRVDNPMVDLTTHTQCIQKHTCKR